jgi:hypothetical protein
VAAFAGPDQNPLDCEFEDETPVIKQVTGPANIGPYISATGKTIRIFSENRFTSVKHPAYDGAGGTEPETIMRDYSFGPPTSPGTVTIGGTPLNIIRWGRRAITASVPAGTTTGQLVVTRGDDGRSSVTGVTVTIGGRIPIVVENGGSIQDAIDNARTGDLIIVKPGTYNENVIMWRPVRLQGWGARSTFINAFKTTTDILTNWRQKVQHLVGNGIATLLPGQELEFFTEEGAGIFVVPRMGGFAKATTRIDGFTITGASTGGGIMVNGYANDLEISNNRIINNSGFFNGGIRLGHPELTSEVGGDTVYQDAFNDNITIHHNQITQNGGLGGAGGGISLCTGSDGYDISQNFICGNFSMGHGGGIGHLGLSDNGLIRDNTIIFNEIFNQGLTVSGGAIYVGGQSPIGPDILSPGSGSVTISGNLILGNSAGAGDGAGIRTSNVNGQDVDAASTNPVSWYEVNIINNMITNNVAGLAGGGISMQDTAKINILHNTIANNDSTATAGLAFAPGSPNESAPQPAGIVSYAHSPELTATFGSDPAVDPLSEFSNPQLADNIIWHNRTFNFFVDSTATPPVSMLVPDVTVDPAIYDDLAVLGTAAQAYLSPENCILSETVNPVLYDVSNIYLDPIFLAEYFNGNRELSITLPEQTTAIQAPAAFDEGGNFIRLRYGPLTLRRMDTGNLYGDYHVNGASPAVDAGQDVAVTADFDAEARPNGPAVDIGADEAY